MHNRDFPLNKNREHDEGHVPRCALQSFLPALFSPSTSILYPISLITSSTVDDYAWVYIHGEDEAGGRGERSTQVKIWVGLSLLFFFVFVGLGCRRGQSSHRCSCSLSFTHHRDI